MRTLRRRLFRDDVQSWSQTFLDTLEALDDDKDMRRWEAAEAKEPPEPTEPEERRR